MSGPKVSIGTVAEVLKKNAADPAFLRAVIEELNLAVQPDDAEDTAPAVKKQFVILVSDPSGKMLNEVFNFPDLAGWVLQIPENESAATTEDRIRRASYDFNASRKGRLMPVKTVGDAIENVPARFFKEADVWVKTKTPVLVLRTDNQIPREPKEVTA